MGHLLPRLLWRGGGHHEFRLVLFAQLVLSRRPKLGPPPKTALCSLTLPTPVSGCPSFCFFILQALSVFLCLCMYVGVSLPYHSGRVCLSLPLQLSLPGFVPLHLFLCLSVFVSPSLYISLPSASLFTNACLSLSLSAPSHPPVLLLFSGLLPLGGCSSRTRQPGDTSGHCPESTSRSPPHARHLCAASVYPLQLWGVEGAPGREDTVPASAPEPRSP